MYEFQSMHYINILWQCSTLATRTGTCVQSEGSSHKAILVITVRARSHPLDIIYIIQIYSGITSGRVLIGKLSYTEILEVNLFAFAYRLFREDFPPMYIL